MKRKSTLLQISTNDQYSKKLKAATCSEIPQREQHEDEQELVKLILSDNLLEIPQGLKDQLIHKVKVLHINFHKIDTIPELAGITYLTTVTTKQLNNLIIAITTKNCFSLFKFELILIIISKGFTFLLPVVIVTMLHNLLFQPVLKMCHSQGNLAFLLQN